MIHREREPGTRRDVYVVADDAWHDTHRQHATSSTAPIQAAISPGVDAVGGPRHAGGGAAARRRSTSSTSSPTRWPASPTGGRSTARPSGRPDLPAGPKSDVSPVWCVKSDMVQPEGLWMTSRTSRLSRARLAGWTAVVALTRLGRRRAWGQLRRRCSAAPPATRPAGRADVVRTAHGRYALPTADQARVAASRLTGCVSHTSAAGLHWGWAVKAPPVAPQVTVPRPPAMMRRAESASPSISRDLAPDEVSRRMGDDPGPHRHRLLSRPPVRPGAGHASTPLGGPG